MTRSCFITSRSVSSLLLASLVLLAGCSQDQYSDLREFMANTGSTAQPALEPLPEVKPQTTFTYDPGDSPDPFQPRSLKQAKGGGAFQPDLNRPKGPLEQFPLDGLRMVGTISMNKQLFALVQTPLGTLYRVTKGNHMGLNFGLVIGISDVSIELRETVQDGVGDWTESKATLDLQE
jgi:type IV pilus assembly protein PilP